MTKDTQHHYYAFPRPLACRLYVLKSGLSMEIKSVSELHFDTMGRDTALKCAVYAAII